MPELRKRQREVDYTGGKQDADRSKRTTATRAKKPKTAKEPAAPTTKAKRVAATPVEAAEPKESKEPKGPKESKKNAPAAAAKSDSAPAKKNASAKNASAKKNASAAPKKNAPGTKKNASANATNKQAAKKYKDIITAVSKVRCLPLSLQPCRTRESRSRPAYIDRKLTRVGSHRHTRSWRRATS